MTSRAEATLWIDLTMLMRWQGHLTGIQRTEYNLAKRYAGKPGVKFCVFDKTRDALLQLDFDSVEKKVSELLRHRETSKPGSRAKLMRSARRAVDRVTPGIVKRGARAVTRSIPFDLLSATARVVVEENDSFLIMSADWLDLRFARFLGGLKRSHRIKVFQIVYDLLPVFHPGLFPPGVSELFAAYMREIFQLCDGTLAISRATRNDIVRFQEDHRLPDSRIAVIRLGEDFGAIEPRKPPASLVPGDFILCVGTVEARKNHRLICLSIKEAARLNERLPPIVIVGRRGWLVSDLMYEIEHDATLNGALVFVHDVNDHELAWLFENCLYSIFPSQCEGWGLPVAESLHHGKLCLASSSSSLPEIAGDLIEYFSPYDAAALLSAMLKYRAAPSLLAEKEGEIRRRFRPTSWDETFRQVETFLGGARGSEPGDSGP